MPVSQAFKIAVIGEGYRYSSFLHRGQPEGEEASSEGGDSRQSDLKLPSLPHGKQIWLVRDVLGDGVGPRWAPERVGA